MGREKRIAAIFVFAAALLGVSLVIAYSVGQHALRANELMATQRRVIEHLIEILSTLKDAETGRSGYLLTGKEEYLKPYRAAIARLQGEIQNLHDLGDKGLLNPADVAKAEDLISKRMALLDQTVAMRRTNFDAALAVVQAGEGKRLMDEIRGLLENMQQDGEHEYLLAASHSNRATLLRTWVFLLTGLVNLAFLGWAYRRISHETRKTETATKEISRQKEILSTTLASIGDGVVVTDPAGKVTFLNPEAERLTGWTTAEARGRALLEIFRIVNEATRQPVENPVEKVLRLGQVVGLANHTILIAKDGRETPIDDSAAPIRQGSGPLLGVVLVFRDFSAHKNAEAQREQAHKLVQTARERSDLLSQTVSALLTSTEPQRLLEDLCEKVRTFLGCAVFFNFLLDAEKKRLLLNACGGVDPRLARKVESLELGQSLCGTAARDGCRVLEQQLAQSNDPRSALVRSLGIRAYACHPLLGSAGEVIGTLSFGADNRDEFTQEDLDLMKAVTDHVAVALTRHRAEEALREAGERFRTMADGLPLIIWVHDAEGRQQFVNRTFCEFFGIKGQITGEQWRELLHPDDAAEYIARFLDAVQQRRSFHAHARVKNAAGQWRWIESFAQPRFSDSGEFLGMVGVSPDITERKQAEAVLTRDREQLEHLVAERTARLKELVAELEHFSYTITHDMRAPLRAMRGVAEIMLESDGQWPPEERRNFTQRIITAAQRMDALITDALHYSRVVKEEVPIGLVDADKLLRGVLDTYPNLQSDNADILIEGTLPVVHGNEAGLTQCFSNLLGNAVKFVRPGQKPQVRIWAEPSPDAPDLVRICVQDNGPGISPGMLPRVFDMFARGSDPQAGTGIGLALVRKVVDRMGGKVGVQSEIGRGSLFWIQLRKAS